MNDPPFLIWSSASVSHTGNVRAVNEDACLDMPELGLWAVADGMGGHEAGGFASAAIVQQLKSLPPAEDLPRFVEAIQSRLVAANELVHQEVLRRNRLAGSTVAVLAAYGHTAACLWAGDSRVYLYRAGLLRRLTHDHSAVEEQLAQGQTTVREGAPEHPLANVITRAVGPEDTLALDTAFTDIQHSDTFVVCTDGLYKELSDEEFASILSRQASSRGDACTADAETIARALIDAALAHGGRDNVSLVLVRFAHPF